MPRTHGDQNPSRESWRLSLQEWAKSLGGKSIVLVSFGPENNVREDMIERGIGMAQCDEGYLCQVCGEEVKRIDQSLLYLRYVLGWITVDQLTKQPEAHLQCTPAVAQFIVDADFHSKLPVDPALDKQQLDADFRQTRENLITGGYQRLKHLQKHRRSLTITQYPIPNEPEPIPEVDGSTNNSTA